MAYALLSWYTTQPTILNIHTIYGERHLSVYNLLAVQCTYTSIMQKYIQNI